MGQVYEDIDLSSITEEEMEQGFPDYTMRDLENILFKMFDDEIELFFQTVVYPKLGINTETDQASGDDIDSDEESDMDIDTPDPITLPFHLNQLIANEGQNLEIDQLYSEYENILDNYFLQFNTILDNIYRTYSFKGHFQPNIYPDLYRALRQTVSYRIQDTHSRYSQQLRKMYKGALIRLKGLKREFKDLFNMHPHVLSQSEFQSDREISELLGSLNI